MHLKELFFSYAKFMEGAMNHAPVDLLYGFALINLLVFAPLLPPKKAY